MLQPLDESRRRVRPAPSPSSPGRIPPHNLEAEESLLGAMLLSRDAIAVAVERCVAEDFYKPSHAHIFSAITALYSRGEPADAVTVAEELRRAGVLEETGARPPSSPCSRTPRPSRALAATAGSWRSTLSSGA